MLIKKITSAILAVAMVAAMSTTVMASNAAPRYIDGDREVEYFGYTAQASNYYYTYASTSAPKYFKNRNWVVSLGSNGGATYPTFHGLFVANSGIASPAGGVCQITGTGNSGGGFSDSYWTYGAHYVIGSRLSPNEGTTKYLSGQYSPDAAY